MAMREFLYDTKPLPEEPDDLVVINPTRVNEPDGAILVYRKEGVLLFDGKQIPIGKIVEGYVSNSNNNPYLPVAYHILRSRTTSCWAWTTRTLSIFPWGRTSNGPRRP